MEDIPMEKNGNLITAYFDALDSQNIDAAIALFASDALYIRPDQAARAAGGQGLAAMRGKEAILATLDTRGAQHVRHVVDCLITDGNASSAQGHIEGMENRIDIFLASAVANEAGLIAEFSIIGQQVVTGADLLTLDAGVQ
jgi:hypothetical protein